MSFKGRHRKLGLRNFWRPFHFAQIERLQSISMGTIEKEFKPRTGLWIRSWGENQTRTANWAPLSAVIIAILYAAVLSKGLQMSSSYTHRFWSQCIGRWMEASPSRQLIKALLLQTISFLFLFWIKKKLLVPDNTLFSVLFGFIFLPCWCRLSPAAIMREPSWKKTKHCFFSWSFKTRCLTSERLSEHPHKIPLCNLTNQKYSGTIEPN